jgi:hypothetical protein
MGNGFCFPLETLLFTVACVAVGAGKPGIDFTVYGDDIIVRKQYFEPLLQLLRYMGFTANTDKTFSMGPFRESCGADWFGGVDVRPFTLDYALDSVENVYKFLNLTRRNALTSAFFEDLRPYILGLIPQSLHFYRPFIGDANTGIDSVGSEFMTSTNCRFLRRIRSWSWRELHFTSVPDNFWKKESGKHLSSVHVFGALGGSAAACPYAFRRKTKTKVRLVSHPGATSLWTPT